MTPQLPPDPRAEFEAKLTACLLGELSAEEAARVRRIVADDPELQKLQDRLGVTLDLLREVVRAPAPSPLKLSPDKREKLLAQFKTVTPQFAPSRRWNISWLAPLAAAAAVLVLSAILFRPTLRTPEPASAPVVQNPAPAQQNEPVEQKLEAPMLPAPVAAMPPKDVAKSTVAKKAVNADKLDSLGIASAEKEKTAELHEAFDRAHVQIPVEAPAAAQAAVPMAVATPAPSSPPAAIRGFLSDGQVEEAAAAPAGSYFAARALASPEIQTRKNALDTFELSLNKNDASFNLAAASLEKGAMPPAASIQTGDFINAFNYHDPEPLPGNPAAFTWERAGDSFVRHRELLRLSIAFPAARAMMVEVAFNPNRVASYRRIGIGESGNAFYAIEIKSGGKGPLGAVRAHVRLSDAGDYQTEEWTVPYTGSAAALEKASPAMRLEAAAASFAEWLADGPQARKVTPDGLLRCLRGVSNAFPRDPGPKKLEQMIREARNLPGR